MLVDAVDDEGLQFLYLSVPVLKTGLGVLIQVLLSESLAIRLLAPLIEYLKTKSSPLLLQRQD